jgi:ribosome-dependent ATPase
VAKQTQGIHMSLAAKLRGVSLRYGDVLALDSIDLDIPAGYLVGIIGSDGDGKSSLLSLISGARKVQTGLVELFGDDMSNKRYREKVCSRIAYMPQGLGKNLYSNLSVFENVDFFGRLFGLNQKERLLRTNTLLQATGLAPFKDRLAGKLSGGMQQKLGICCALIHEPDILILDEPTTGVDPLSRRQFWEMIHHIRQAHVGMSILVTTAYMEEASAFEWLIAMHNGKVLFSGKIDTFLEKKDSHTVEEAFIAMLPEERLKEHKLIERTPRQTPDKTATFIEAHNLTKHFNGFTAVNHVSFQIEQGEIFGFLGPNGSGKTTTMKMLTGLLPPSEGEAKLFGHLLNPHDLETRKRIGYMSQSFSLYIELTAKQNLILHARLFNIPEEQILEKVEKIIQRFGLQEETNVFPKSMALGQRQRLSLAVAMLPSPEILILDEPTSGVDPIARDAFWHILMELSRKDKVTIFISTHFMNEAERCDRVSLMHAGNVLSIAPPADLIKQCHAKNLEEAFIKLLEKVGAFPKKNPDLFPARAVPKKTQKLKIPLNVFCFQRMTSYVQREALELYRDYPRLIFSILGSIVLLLAFGFGISVDVENLSFAVLDRDQTNISRDYISNIAGSRYFIERAPIKDYQDLDKRMRSGDISLSVEIPSGFARDIRRGRPVHIGAWIDGAMPRRAEIILNYMKGVNLNWLTYADKKWVKNPLQKEPVSIETRYLYNPDVTSQKAMVPAAFAIVLMTVPAMLSTLAVVREKELGSIVNLYVSPTTRLEFLIGKQIPYIILAMISFFLMLFVTAFVFDVPLKGNFLTLLLGTFLFVCTSTALGLLVSTFTKSQTAAIFATGVLTLLPTINFSGLIDPISSLEGIGAFIGNIFPTTFYLSITRGVFSKGLGFKDLTIWFIPLLISIPLLLGLSVLFLKKQET